ncbi:MAG: hypothetical protein SPL79_01120 [Sphaerochaetaceae bacterium]|nr:hypothetical protein [Sphaerochaetaceae bacterium]
MFRRNKVLHSLLASWMPKVIALIAALLLYVFGSYANRESRNVTIPVSVELPALVVAVSTVPATVDVKISGKGDVIYLVNPEMIKASVDFSKVDKRGIAVAPVVLDFDQTAFVSGSITLEATPSQYRVMFETPGSSVP